MKNNQSTLVQEITLYVLNEKAYASLSRGEKSRFYDELVTPTEKGIFRIKYPDEVKGWYSMDAGLITSAGDWIKEVQKVSPTVKKAKSSKPVTKSNDQAPGEITDVFACVAEYGSPSAALEALSALKKPTKQQTQFINQLQVFV